MFYSDPLTSLSNIMSDLNETFTYFSDPKFLQIYTAIVKTIFEGLVEGHHERERKEAVAWYSIDAKFEEGCK